ncbi:AsmA family protein, partial [Solidesulfovibrio sp.]|uniref:AsmA family protein n=1 Tax=Solidesulfovibrio sp. TaxID=2910990 RepID=UPI002627FD1E
MPSATPSKLAGSIRRLPRLVALAAVCGALLVFVLPYAARQVIGAQRLKAVAEQTLTDALGRRVTIDGEVSVMFAPWFGLVMGPVSVAEGPEFGDGPMLSARRLEMTIRMLPLAARVVSPGSVRVRDLAVHLRRDASGRGNWEDLAAPRTAAAAEAPGWEIAPEPRDILVENASVDYRDATTGRAMSVRDVTLKTGQGQPFSFSLAFKADGFLPGGSLECHAGGKASLDPASGAFTLEKTLVETDLVLDRPLVAGGASPTRVVARLAAAYDPATGQLSLTGLDARLPGARLTGSALAVAPAGIPKVRAALGLDLDMHGSWRDILGLVPAEGPDSLVAAPPTTPREPAPAAAEDAMFSAEVPSPGPGRASLSLNLSAEPGLFSVDGLTLSLPKGRIVGAGRLVPGAPASLDASLRAEDVDFDALPRPAGRTTWPWPLPWPTDGAADARLELRRCKIGGLTVSDGHVTARAQDGILRLAPASFALPGGIVSLDARFDAGLPPASGAKTPPESLGVDVRATIQPFSGEAGPVAQPSQARLLGRLRAEGAKGNLSAQSPDPARALAVLGLAEAVPSGGPLEAKSAFSLTPGINRLAAKASLTGLEGKLAGATLRGHVSYDADAPVPVDFDLALDSLDPDRLSGMAGLAGGATEPAGAAGSAPKAEGKLRLDRLSGRGLDARNLALNLTLDGRRLDGAVTGGELFGGKVSGKFEAEASGRATGSLQLSGAEARRLPGLAGSGLSGAVTAKASLEAAAPAKGHPAAVSAVIEADAPQLALGSGGKAQPLSGAKATLTVKGRRAAGEGFEGDANLVLGLASGFGLREARLAAAGPLNLDASGKWHDLAPLKVEASGVLRASETGKAVKASLAGQVAPDGAGGFSASDLRLDAGGLAATLKLAKKGGEAGPVSFSLETGNLAPRRILADWGLAPPEGLAADKLARASLALSGTATAEACDIKRLSLSVDDVNVTGGGQLAGFDPKRGKWDLRVDRLDWDAYFPRPPAAGPPPLSELRKPLDLRLVRELALDAHIAFGWLKKGNVTFDASSVTASAKGGQFTYRQESPRFYGGRFFAEIRGDARDTALKTLVELKLESIEIARFLWDWAEGNTLDSGAATFILAARTSGENEQELRGNLAGNASLQITRGNLKVREPASKPGAEPTYERIPFDVFSSSWFSKGGVAHSDDFRIESPRMRVAGKGFVDLRDESINLSLS